MTITSATMLWLLFGCFIGGAIYGYWMCASEQRYRRQQAEIEAMLRRLGV
ncbi:hypothetical protein [Falsiroseomonas tokyonensis]|uniref:Uncharacterized protein n=1 Tax=Falsiroseomonas tokyonensis TaxID=430521 RepID=A0ABV7BX64_9PROT|nr:hypothetical protein [Falsiroseomonas tokyonensis]MBU8540207.1 hypothetical protein [Falsiroseomonas tokyonensis]